MSPDNHAGHQPTQPLQETLQHLIEGHTSIKALARAAGVSDSCIRWRLDQWGMILGLAWGERDKTRILVEAIKQGFVDIPRIAAMVLITALTTDMADVARELTRFTAMMLLIFATLQATINPDNTYRLRRGTRSRRDEYHYSIQRISA